MRWDNVLDRLRDRGFRPLEEDFVESYGLYAADERRIPGDRHFRCTRGYARFDGAEVEMILFPSGDEAGEFLRLIRKEGGWAREGKVLVRLTGANVPLLREAIREVLTPS